MGDVENQNIFSLGSDFRGLIFTGTFSRVTETYCVMGRLNVDSLFAYVLLEVPIDVCANSLFNDIDTIKVLI